MRGLGGEERKKGDIRASNIERKEFKLCRHLLDMMVVVVGKWVVASES